MRIVDVAMLPIAPDEKNQIRDVKYDITRGFIPGSYPTARAPVQPAGPTGILHHNAPEVLPRTRPGENYYEYQIGEARPNDPRPRGRKRLVVLVRGTKILKLYFTAEHYKKGSFVEIH